MTTWEASRILGVDPWATPDELTSAWRRGVLRHHPDRNPGDPVAAARFQQVQDAYQVLSTRATDNAGFQAGVVEANHSPATTASGHPSSNWSPGFSGPVEAPDSWAWRLAGIPVLVLAVLAAGIQLGANPFTGLRPAFRFPAWTVLTLLLIAVFAFVSPPRLTRSAVVNLADLTGKVLLNWWWWLP